MSFSFFYIFHSWIPHLPLIHTPNPTKNLSSLLGSSAQIHGLSQSQKKKKNSILYFGSWFIYTFPPRTNYFTPFAATNFCVCFWPSKTCGRVFFLFSENPHLSLKNIPPFCHLSYALLSPFATSQLQKPKAYLTL